MRQRRRRRRQQHGESCSNNTISVDKHCEFSNNNNNVTSTTITDPSDNDDDDDDDDDVIPSQPQQRRRRGRRRLRPEMGRIYNSNNISSLLKLVLLLLSCPAPAHCSSHISNNATTTTAAAATTTTSVQLQTPVMSLSSSPAISSGYLDVQPFCNKNVVTVSVLYLTCDSPGAYYYGSTTYRNSVVCIANDQANIKMKLSISEKMNMNETVYIKIESGVYDRFATVIEPTKLCQLDIVPYDDSTGNNGISSSSSSGSSSSSISTSSSRSCPNPGTYFFKTYYIVPELLKRSTDYESIHYTPDVKVTFTDSQGNRLGCAAAGAVAVHVRATTQGQRGFLALAISLSVFVVVFAVLLVLSYWRQKRLEQMAERKKPLRYQYFRTLPNGQVIPLPANSTGGGGGTVSMSHSQHGVVGTSSLSPQQQQQSYHQQQQQQQYNMQQQEQQPQQSPHQQQYLQQQQHHQQQHYHQHSLRHLQQQQHGQTLSGVHPDAYNLPNPSYNETQLPTRPVI